jgi:hypothetical protein
MITMSEKIDQISIALSKAQSELESVKKDSQGYGYNYSDLSSVIATAKPVLAKNGLAVVQLVGELSDNKVHLTTVLTHSSGQFFQSVSSAPLIEMKGANAMQAFGAVISYSRRYAFQAILGMSSEDPDASPNGFEKPQAKPAFKAPVKTETLQASSNAEPSTSSFRRPASKGSDL